MPRLKELSEGGRGKKSSKLVSDNFGWGSLV
jgi:hypothetical protein